MRHLREELGDGFEAMLLDAHQAQQPAAAARERARVAAMAALGGTALVTGLGGAKASGAAAKLVGTVAWKSAVLGALVGGVVTGVVVEATHAYHGHVAAPAPAAVAPAVSPVVVEPVAPVTATVGTPPPVVAPAPVVAPRPAARRAPEVAPAEVAPVSPPEPEPAPIASPAESQAQGVADLDREVAAIDVARAALRSHDFRGCLHLLDVYEIEHRAGALTLEAEALRIEALFGAGERREAITRARAFLAAHPHGPYRSRLEQLIAAP
jgi:hypothetical protein